MQGSFLTYLCTVLAASAVTAAPTASENELMARYPVAPHVARSLNWARGEANKFNGVSRVNKFSGYNRANDDNRDNRDDRDNGNNRNNNNNDQDIAIQQEEVTVVQNNGDEEAIFQRKVTQIVIENNDSNNRRNRERARDASNRNRDQTTVIQVVQTIIQVEDNGNRRTRYAVSEVIANPGADQTQTNQVWDAQSLTVGECAQETAEATATAASAADATGTGAAGAAAAAATNDVSAPFLQSNQTQLLPEDSGAPQAGAGVSVLGDAAWDILADVLNIC